MIHILAQFSVKEDKVSEFIELCKELVKESRQEEGCVAYNLEQNREKDNHFVFVEQWKSERDIEIHNASKHFTKIVPMLIELCEKDPTIETFNSLV